MIFRTSRCLDIDKSHRILIPWSRNSENSTWAGTRAFDKSYHRWSVSDVHLAADSRVLSTAHVPSSIWSSPYKPYHATIRVVFTEIDPRDRLIARQEASTRTQIGSANCKARERFSRISIKCLVRYIHDEEQKMCTYIQENQGLWTNKLFSKDVQNYYKEWRTTKGDNRARISKASACLFHFKSLGKIKLTFSIITTGLLICVCVYIYIAFE